MLWLWFSEEAVTATTREDWAFGLGLITGVAGQKITVGSQVGGYCFFTARECRMDCSVKSAGELPTHSAIFIDQIRIAGVNVLPQAVPVECFEDFVSIEKIECPPFLKVEVDLHFRRDAQWSALFRGEMTAFDTAEEVDEYAKIWSARRVTAMNGRI